MDGALIPPPAPPHSSKIIRKRLVMDKKSYADVAKVPPPPMPPLPRTASNVKMLTADDVNTGIEKFTEQFRNSHRSQDLPPFFELGQKRKITQCICLGLGHFMRLEKRSKLEKAYNGDFNTALHQLAMLQILLEGLAKRNTIQVYVQDSAFSGLEKEYLRSCGFSLLLKHGDSAATIMSPSTFLFAPRRYELSVPVALGHTFPALYIGTDVDRAIDFIAACDVKSLPAGGTRERYLGPMQRFKSASAETQPLPILAYGIKLPGGHESWQDASVRWLKTGDDGEGDVGEDRSGEEKRGGRKTGRKSMLSSSGAGEIGEGEVIDWWGHDHTD